MNHSWMASIFRSAAVLLYLLGLAVVLISCTQPSDSTPPETGALVTTLAGKAQTSGSNNGTGAEARFNEPWGITTDGTNLYVADCGNHKIRQVVISTGVVTTLAGSGSPGSANGTGTSAQFARPCGITIDSTHTNLYVADTESHTIRQIVISTGEVTTLAGTPGASGSDNGTGSEAQFCLPRDLTTDDTYLYVADFYNHAIRRILISTKEVTTLAGTPGTSGSSDSSSPPARFYQPCGITTDGTYLYVADTWNNTIRGMTTGGLVGTLAGAAGSYGWVDGIGSAAQFRRPYGITTDETNLYVADTENYKIRKIVISTAEVTTLAGGLYWGTSDGRGSAAGFNLPCGITTDGTYLYVADTENHTIRVVTE